MGSVYLEGHSSATGADMRAVWTLGAAIVVLVALGIGGGLGGLFGSATVTRGTSLSEIEEAQSAAATKISEKLPMHVDDATLLMDVTAEGKVLHYRYNMELAASELPSSFAQDLQAMVTSKACGDEQMLKFIKLGAVYRYEYDDVEGSPLTDFKIDGFSCSRPTP